MELIYQPAEVNRLGDYLNENLRARWTHFRAAVAFVKRSGVQHIEENLASFSNSSSVEIIAGIDHQGTSYEGLQSLLDSVSPPSRVIVFHNPTFITFHPKIYLFKSAIAADVVIGSGNLTQGGLYANYEAGLRLQLDLTDSVQTAMLQYIENVLDHWGDQSTGTARLLDSSLLAQLVAWGLTPAELLHSTAIRNREQTRIASLGSRTNFPFAVRVEAGAPTVPSQRRSMPGIATQTSRQTIPSLGFLMTLQRTDVGVGQTTSGTSRRSPEIFVPLAARNADPGFWKWPYGFTSDPKTHGKFDRQGVVMRLGGDIIKVNMMTWPIKRDFRLRSESLRSAGEIGDILRMERSLDPNASYEYYVEIVPQGTTQYPLYLALCQQRIRNSLKRFGYY